MKQRCINPNTTGFENYGGRGIDYIPEWENFETFKEWAIQSGYNDALTIDRIDEKAINTPIMENRRNKRETNR